MKYIKKLIFTAFFIILITNILYSRNKSVRAVSLNSNSVKISPDNMLIFYDPGNKHSSDTIAVQFSQDKFQKLQSDKIGDKDIDFYTFWIYFEIENDHASVSDWVLFQNSSFYGKTIELYQWNEDKKLMVRQNPIERNYNQFRITLNPGEKTTCYLSCKFFDPYLSLEIKESHLFFKATQGHVLFYGIFFGFIISLIFYSLFLLFSIKDYSYIFFVCFILSNGLYILITNQIGYNLFPGGGGYWTSIGFYLARNATFVFFILFGKAFFIIKKHKNIFDILCFICLGIFLIHSAVFVCITAVSGNPSVLIFFENFIQLIVLVIFVMFSYYSIKLLFYKNRSYVYFSIANILFILLTLLYVFTLAGLLPFSSEDLNYSKILEYFTMLIFLLFSFALSERIAQMKKQKQTAQQLAIDNLHKADKLKDDFLANTTHELKTPLHCIASISESILNGDIGTSGKDLNTNIDLILKSSKRLNNLINDILDYSKMKYQDIILDKKNINISPIIHVAVQTISNIVKTKDIELLITIPDNLPYIRGDENRVYQIIFNLLGNAVKFTDRGFIKIGAELKENFIEISIIDSGIGIDEKDLDVIFKPFFQTGSSTERVYDGAGLGLSITRYLVELHGGEIRAESMNGRGTTFYFTLPVSHEKNETENIQINNTKTEINTVNQSITNEDKIINKPDASILIVDDDPVNQKLIYNILSKQNYNLFISSNGHEALEKIDNHENIDLVLLDIMMPDLSGYDVCLKIREKYNLYEKPVIFLTAKNDIHDIISGFDAGANDYLAKPFNNNEFKTRIKTLLKLKKITHLNDALTRTNELKKQLMDLAAHDLRNPLSNILISLDIIKKVINQDLKAYKIIESIYRSTNKMNTLIDELLENSFIEDGKILLKKELLNPNDIINKSIESFYEKAKRKKQKILFNTELDNCFIMLDRIRFQAIIDNLLSNAVKYSQSGKKINVITQKLSKKNDEESILIKIIDQGPGFTDDDMTKVFNKFQKLSAKPTAGEISTGLGLAITKKLVELHNGIIRLESRHGKGSTFFVEIPCTL